MQYDVRADLREALSKLENLRKDQIPFATAYALTQTAKDSQTRVQREMRSVFNNPTPYTLAGLFVKPATKSKLTSTVKFKDQAFKGVPADRYITVQVEGGARRAKGFEELLIRSGVMPPNSYAVPTRAAKLDQYGNVPRGTLNAILSQLQASRDVLSRETPVSKARAAKRRNRRTSRYFTAYPGRARTKHLPPGIYERVGFGFGSAIRPVFLFVERAPVYKPRLPFYRIMSETLRLRLTSNFEKGFLIADATKQGTLAQQTNALFAVGIGDYLGGTRLPRTS